MSSSSSMPTSSSSQVMSSSSAGADCSSVDTSEGKTLYLETHNCDQCHGEFSPARGIFVGNSPFPNIDPNSLNGGRTALTLGAYIASDMIKCNGDASCEAEAQKIAQYINQQSDNTEWCEGLTQSSSSAPQSSSSQVASSSSAPSMAKVIYAINVGSTEPATYNGVTYEAESNFRVQTSGDVNGTASTTSGIDGTTEDALFQSQRYGNYTFELPVIAGDYNVTLYLAEEYADMAGIRVMAATAEGAVILNNVDLYDAHNGRLKALTYTVEDVGVSDDNLTIDLSAVTNYATLSGILVTSVNGDKREVVAPPSACDGTNHYVCLDFESGQFPLGYEVGSQVSIATNDGARGTANAMRFETSITSGYHQGLIRKANVPGTHWGRMYYKTSPNLSGGFHHTSYGIFTADDWEARFIDTVQQGSGQLAYLFNVQRNTDAECGAGNYEQCEYRMESGYIYNSPNEWICMEWHMDTATQQFEVFRDGNRINGASGHMQNDVSDRNNAKVVPNTLNWIGFGSQTFRAPIQEGLVDEIIVSSSRVGCD